MAYDWPGNVRELENVVQRILALPAVTDSLGLGAPTPSGLRQGRGPVPAEGQPGDLSPLQEYLKTQEYELIAKALRLSGNNISRAARLLKVPRTTLRCKLEKMGLGASGKASASQDFPPLNS